MRQLVVLLPLLLWIGSCGSPPKPPNVDESRKRPVNAPAAIELQTCRTDLQNTKVLASECVQEVASIRAWATRRSATTVAVDSRPPEESRNAVYSILFAFGSSRPALSPSELTRLVDEARRSPWIQLSGRTDGTIESPAESKVARERAEAVRNLLIRNGVEPARIRATWQPIGDPAAANDSEGGRSLNRRVEIELYRVAPRHLSLSTPSMRDES
jgi:outer membrane protein OmpA-like peptidoglycan-associated protein